MHNWITFCCCCRKLPSKKIYQVTQSHSKICVFWWHFRSAYTTSSNACCVFKTICNALMKLVLLQVCHCSRFRKWPFDLQTRFCYVNNGIVICLKFYEEHVIVPGHASVQTPGNESGNVEWYWTQSTTLRLEWILKQSIIIVHATN